MSKINCKHWLDCNHPHGGCCAIKLFGDQPVSRGICMSCDKREPMQPAPESDLALQPASSSPPAKTGGLQRVRHAARSIMGGAAGMLQSLTGQDKADEQTVAARLTLCESCKESLPQDAPVIERRCGRLIDVLNPDTAPCGCGLASKTKLKGQACPLGKWSAIEGPSNGH